MGGCRFSNKKSSLQRGTRWQRTCVRTTLRVSQKTLECASVFWDTRSVVRTQVLCHLVPRCKELFLLLKRQPPIPPPTEFQTIASARLERLRELCEAHGAKLIILVPPTPS